LSLNLNGNKQEMLMEGPLMVVHVDLSALEDLEGIGQFGPQVPQCDPPT
jgi:hypothetical protein